MRLLSCRAHVYVALLAITGVVAPSAAQESEGRRIVLHRNGKPDSEAAVWLESSLKRVFPHSPTGSTNLGLIAARNGRVAFQVCVHNYGILPLRAECSISDVDDVSAQVRTVGYVPVRHFSLGTDPSELDGIGFLPGLAPDPLYPKNHAEIGSQETQPFWITLRVNAEAKPGIRECRVRVQLNKGTSVDVPVRLEISPLEIQPRRDFHVTHWWRGEATWDYYHTGMFDERWWKLTRAQLADMLDHGSDVVYVPSFFNRRETFERPCQLLIVDEQKPGTYSFDWSRVERFTEMCREIGFTEFEWPHLWIYWGLNNPMRIYKKAGEHFQMLWPPDSDGFSDTYLNFLRQFLPSFHEFLERGHLLEHSYFHVSDEPGGSVEKYRRARSVLHEIAPWMKVMDALSDIRFGKQGLTDLSVPMVSAAQGYIDAGIPHWVYFCCEPAGPWVNRFQDTPLPKIRMAGWLFYRLGAKGFLHWGFNYWDRFEHEGAIDPFSDTTGGGGVPAGDPFVIYPGPDGPIDSIRWEVFSESLQDYAILQTAKINPSDPLLASIKTYADFPKNEEWIKTALHKVLSQGESHGSAGIKTSSR